MDQTEAIKKTKEFYETSNINAENIIFQKIPERLVHLYELINKPEYRIPVNYIEFKFDTTVIAKIENNVNNYAEGETPNDTDPEQILVPSNKNLTEYFEILKSNMIQLLEDNRVLKMWITLLIPKTEDGDNFGVSIQKNALSLIQQIESATITYFGKLSRYYEYRGKLISKIVKYPFIEDYHIAANEFDEKQNIDISILMHEIYFFYTILYNVINKNFEKIKNPRSSNIDCLY
jgi:proteasome activator subunit 3 (PA28 gamma)